METRSVASPATDPAASLYALRSWEASQRSGLIDWFRNEDRRILDVGCGTGVHARELKRRGVEVHGVTLSPVEMSQATQEMERATLANVETWSPDYPQGFFDALLFSHVLEHLINPIETLTRLAPLLRPGGRVYIALPNISFWRYRIRALWGRFDYEEMGPMDKTHLRFFTYFTAQSLLESSGFSLLRVQALGHVPLGPLRRVFPKWAKRMDRLALQAFPNLFGYEIQLSASKSA